MRYDLQGGECNGGGMQLCGCQLGRPCTCGMRQVKNVAPTVEEETPFDEVEVAPGVVLRLKKEFEYKDETNTGRYLDMYSVRNVPGTKKFKLMYQYRRSLLDAIVEMSAKIEDAAKHYRQISIELTQIAAKKENFAKW